MAAWSHNETHPLAEEAAAWLIVLEEPQPRTLEQFAAWLQRSPRHVEEFLLASAVWKELDGIDSGRQLQIQQLIEEAKNNVRQLAPETQRALEETPRVHRTMQGFRVAGMAVAMLVAGAVLWYFVLAAPDVYATSRGEQRAFKLEDGSVIYLNTQSRVEVSFSRTARNIRLLEGEAMFAVEHDAGRPFRVMSDQTVIQAIGTRFNVYRHASGTTVSVVEGVVKISPAKVAAVQAPTASATSTMNHETAAPASDRLAAGEQARVSNSGEVVKLALPDLEQVVSWRERRLVFRGDTLENVAREFNRYNGLQIQLEGEAVRTKRLTGVFDADDPRSLLLFLGRDSTFEVAEQGAEAVIIRQR